jgi:hypothetical protein
MKDVTAYKTQYEYPIYDSDPYQVSSFNVITVFTEKNWDVSKEIFSFESTPTDYSFFAAQLINHYLKTHS